MAQRPVFVPDKEHLVSIVSTEFSFYSGFAKIQRQKCVESLHAAFLRQHPEAHPLEISSFSKSESGVSLSAFHLTLSLSNGSYIPVELAYQGGKIFAKDGPFLDLFAAEPGKAKRDPRLHESGKLTHYIFEGRQFSIRPVTLFYTWLYLRALSEHPELGKELMNYNAFTDIVYSPAKSLNCQAFSAAVFVSLCVDGTLDRAIYDPDWLAERLHASSALLESIHQRKTITRR